MGPDRAPTIRSVPETVCSKLERAPSRIFSTPRRSAVEIAIEKTAGQIELEAWSWLMERVRNHFIPKEAAS